MIKMLNYKEFIIESTSDLNYIPTYEDCMEMCLEKDSPFYESKHIVDGYNISVFNYRLAQYSDFHSPIKSNPKIKGYEMRGLTFVFDKDGSLYNRFILLEKFFNLNQVPESMYSIVKDYKIKFVNEKEDGSIASFIKLPNGKIFGKSKMSFNNEQAIGINHIYKNNKDIHHFVNWCMDNNIMPIFEYVAPHNRIVLRYPKEELILLRLRNNVTGKHINISDHIDKIGSIKISPFKDDFNSLDDLIELTGKEIDKEGYVIQAEDSNGKDFFFKLKTPWYCERHGLLTEDLYREHTIISYILDDKIDDILGQVPEEEKEARERIQKIINVVKAEISNKSSSIDILYDKFKEINNKKEFAIRYKNNKDFPFVMTQIRYNEIKDFTNDQKILKYGTIENYEKHLENLNRYML